ncbi:MAG: hypothetical protein K6357_03150 [Elusimicrobiota bacterium]
MKLNILIKEIATTVENLDLNSIDLIESKILKNKFYSPLLFLIIKNLSTIIKDIKNEKNKNIKKYVFEISSILKDLSHSKFAQSRKKIYELQKNLNLDSKSLKLEENFIYNIKYDNIYSGINNILTAILLLIEKMEG